jgi:hypothetical protein
MSVVRSLQSELLMESKDPLDLTRQQAWQGVLSKALARTPLSAVGTIEMKAILRLRL